MSRQQHVVHLTAAERAEVRALLAAGTTPARTQTHARILLKCDAGTGGPHWSDARVAEAVEVSAQEARLVAIACTEPPAGRARWSLRLLSKRLVELEVVAGISPETVRATLKKTSSSRG